MNHFRCTMEEGLWYGRKQITRSPIWVEQVGQDYHHSQAWKRVAWIDVAGQQQILCSNAADWMHMGARLKRLLENGGVGFCSLSAPAKLSNYLMGNPSKPAVVSDAD